MAESDKNIDKTILSAEVASPYSQIFRFVEYMPNPDELLRDRGETLGLYKRMLLDARIYSLIELRKSMALDRSYTIICDDKTVVDFLYEVLSEINIGKALKDMLTALEFGFSVTEVVWIIDDDYGRYIPAEIKLRDPERFNFDYQGNIYAVIDGVRRKLDFPYKFIVHRHGGFESPYGASILKQCYWPWMFKNAGFRFWMTTAEKFGVPTVIAIFESDDEQKARERAQELAIALSNIQGDAAVALGNVKEINTLEVKGNMESFKTLIEACDNQFSYAITGQSLASAEGQYGTRAQAEVHERMFQAIASRDAISLGYTLTNTIIKWLVELNFGSDAPEAALVFDTDEYADWALVKEAIEAGVPVSKRLLYTEYNIPEPEDDNDVFISPKANSASGTQINMSDFSDSDKKKLKRPYIRIS